MKKGLRKIVSGFLAVCLMIVLLPAVVTASGEYDGKTVVIFTGNIRGNVDALPLIASVRADYIARGADVILVDTGNFLQGTRYTSFNSGSTMITLMIAAGYDAVALGTYDFAFGTGTIGAARMAEVHGDVIDFGPLGQLLELNELTALSANIIGVNNYFHSFSANATLTTNSGMTIGFFGLTDAATPDLILESHLDGMIFTDAADAAAMQVTVLEGADLVIGLSNAAVLQVAGAIVIDTTPTAVPGMLTIGAVVIDNETLEYEVRNINLDTFTADTELEAVVNDFKIEVAAAFPRVVHSSVTLNGSIAATRSGETNLGNLWADALRWFAVSGEIDAFFGEDDIHFGNNQIHVEPENVVALWNAGNLRDFIHPGEIIIQDLRRVLPFPNTVAVVYLTGAELLEQLEASAQGLPYTAHTHSLSGSFMHVSGIVYTIDVNRTFNPGEAYRDRIWHRAASVERVTINSINGQPFDPEAIYAVITSNANFNGMDISYVLAARESDTENKSTITTARVADDAVMAFIASLPDMTIGAEFAAAQGRITMIGGEGTALIPLRATAEALGATVEWIAETGIAIITMPDGRVVNVYTREHQIIEGRTYVTMDFFDTEVR